MGGRLVVVRDWPVGRGQDRDRSYPGKRHDGLPADTGLVVEGPTLLSRFSKAHQDAFSRRPPAGVIGVPLIRFPDSPGVAARGADSGLFCSTGVDSFVGELTSERLEPEQLPPPCRDPRDCTLLRISGRCTVVAREAGDDRVSAVSYQSSSKPL
jgi:hypothetical protein